MGGGAATTIEEKFSDASQVNALTGASPTVALHVLWDLPGGKADVPAIQGLEKKYGVKAGSINPNLFQDAEYKYGSIANPSAEIRGSRASQSANVPCPLPGGPHERGNISYQLEKRARALGLALRYSADHVRRRNLAGV